MSTSNLSLSLVYLDNYLVDGQLTNYVGSAFSTHYFRTIPDRLEVAIEADQLETRVSPYIEPTVPTKPDKAG